MGDKMPNKDSIPTFKHYNFIKEKKKLELELNKLTTFWVQNSLPEKFHKVLVWTKSDMDKNGGLMKEDDGIEAEMDSFGHFNNYDAINKVIIEDVVFWRYFS